MAETALELEVEFLITEPLEIDLMANYSVQLTTKEITENGTYKAKTDGAEGYSQVTVNIPKAGLWATECVPIISTYTTL